MSCNDIEVIEDQQTIEITDQQKVIELDSIVASTIEVTEQQEVIELKDEVSDTIQVVNVNGAFVNVGDNYEVFSPSIGQTIFTLSNMLIGPQILLSKVFINGQKIALTTCYTISGSQLTVILPYSLNSGDILEIYY
jgi:hypothetical protein